MDFCVISWKLLLKFVHPKLCQLLAAQRLNNTARLFCSTFSSKTLHLFLLFHIFFWQIESLNNTRDNLRFICLLTFQAFAGWFLILSFASRNALRTFVSKIALEQLHFEFLVPPRVSFLYFFQFYYEQCTFCSILCCSVYFSIRVLRISPLL